MAVIRKLSPRGDDVVAEWTAGDVASEAAARAVFDRVMVPPPGRGRHLAAFAIDTPVKGEHTLIRAFDPTVEEILILPPVMGGTGGR